MSHLLSRYRARVVDVNDPNKQGRVRVSCPEVFGTRQTGWAYPAQGMGGGNGTGSFVVPDVGDLVWIEFESGNPDRAVYSGGIHSAQGTRNEPPARSRGSADGVSINTVGGEPSLSFGAEYPKNRTLKTAAGHVVELDDTPGAERVLVYHTAGACLEINQDGRVILHASDKIWVVAEGDVHVESGGDIILGGASAKRVALDDHTHNVTGVQGGAGTAVTTAPISGTSTKVKAQ